MATTTLGYHREQIDGVERDKPMPKHLHVRIQRWLSRYFTANLPAFLEDWPEQNVICGQDRLIPDIVVCARDAVFENGDLRTPPVLAVEILSPGQTIADLFDKADRLCRSGVVVSWVIWPEKRRAWTYTADDGPIEQNNALALEVGNVQVSLTELWKALPE